MEQTMTPRQRVLGLLVGEEVDRVACYSGMGNVTVAGLEQYGFRFSEVHGDAKKLALTAATSHQLFGFECAVVPYDLCVEAEALGCVMNPYTEVEHLLYPTIKEKIICTEDDMLSLKIPDDIEKRGRIPVVCEAIGLLKQDIGDRVPIGTYILGPFTLAGQIMDLNDLLKLVFKKPDLVNQMLDRLADMLVRLTAVYRAAGADYICVREMGAPTDVLSPRAFRQVVFPHLKKIFDNIDYPKILHICGSTNSVVSIMNECGADAISVEPKNDLLKTREEIGWEPLVFGKVDAYNTLVNGTPEQVEEEVIKCLNEGVDAIWPGCDIWPTAPLANLQAMVKAVEKYGASHWARRNRRAQEG